MPRHAFGKLLDTTDENKILLSIEGRELPSTGKVLWIVTDHQDDHAKGQYARMCEGDLSVMGAVQSYLSNHGYWRKVEEKLLVKGPRYDIFRYEAEDNDFLSDRIPMLIVDRGFNQATTFVGFAAGELSHVKPEDYEWVREQRTAIQRMRTPAG